MEKSIPERVHDLYYRFFPSADCPVTGAPPAPPPCSSAGQGQCPASGRGAAYKHPHVYDVYGRRIDEEARRERDVWRMPRHLYYGGQWEAMNPANSMPLQPNQRRAPGQKEELPTFRQVSSIPKAGTDETWVYPSQQMFYNSLVRKNKADDVTEKDMAAVVTTHNAVNEGTWARLLQWEQAYGRLFPESSKDEPRLLHFRGRPHDLSPKARLKKLLGYGQPFDRHDWTVDRGGREMRYVIDFYYDDAASESNRWPFSIDVRPALDSPTALLLRARMLLHDMLGAGDAASNPVPSRHAAAQDSKH
ncbi:probable cytochrome c-type heme lyase [Selaginella moellendorffii]|nr:probable cytochrome c-type heme lyase [Selaginella moellendorffii]|eukprot:XP_002993340.2 probable cytochrome c-type heme lyase [Selaginella moellendorffii]